MPIKTTSVPPARASDAQSTAPGAPGSPTCPLTTVTDDDSPRWVTGTPADAGAAKAEVTPGTTSKGMTGGDQRLGLLSAAPEDERVAAFEPDDRPSLAGVLDDEGVDLVLASKLTGSLPDVDTQRLGRNQVEQARVDQAVEQDHLRAAPAARRRGG